MNIAMVMLNLEVGGLERVVVDLTLALAKAGHQMSVVTLRGGGALATPLEAAGISVINLNCGEGLKIGYARTLGQALDQIAPTLVHSHGEAALFYASLVRFAPLCNEADGSLTFIPGMATKM